MQRVVILTLLSLFFLKLGDSLIADRYLDDGNFCSPISCTPSNRIECKCRHENYTQVYLKVEAILDALVADLMKAFTA